MPEGKLPFNAFDVLVLVVVVVGILRGRRRGMSQELLDFFMWVGMVAAGSFAYPPGGAYLVKLAHLSPMWADILVYVGAGAVVAFIFLLLKNSLKDRLAGSDFFGRLEYPLAMLSGAIRFLCMLIILLACLNAPLITEAEKKAALKQQMDALGSSFFPSLGELQDSVFVNSLSGAALKKHFSVVLIKPTGSSGASGAAGADPGKKEGAGTKSRKDWDMNK